MRGDRDEMKAYMNQANLLEAIEKSFKGLPLDHICGIYLKTQ